MELCSIVDNFLTMGVNTPTFQIMGVKQFYAFHQGVI